MTKRTILSLAIKVLGIFLVITVLPSLPLAFSSTLTFFRRGSASWEVFLALAMIWGPPFLAVGIGVFLMWASNLLALMLVPDMEDEPLGVSTTITREDVTLLILFGIGVWVAVHALGDLVRQLLSGPIMIQSVGYVGRSLGSDYYGQLIGTALQLIIGLFFALRPRQIGKAIEWFQKQEEIDLTMTREREDDDAREE